MLISVQALHKSDHEIMHVSSASEAHLQVPQDTNKLFISKSDPNVTMATSQCNSEDKKLSKTWDNVSLKYWHLYYLLNAQCIYRLNLF